MKLRPMNQNQVESIYPVTPMQHGMLFHTLIGDAADVYLQQVQCRLRGKVEPQWINNVWQQLTERHEVLRSAFVWNRQKQPLQVVLRDIEVPFRFFDWRGENQSLEAFLQRDRSRTFALEQAPLMRVTLIRLDEDEFEMIWSHHHILLDGWSTGILFNEFRQLYQAASTAAPPSLAAPLPYKRYIDWLQNQDRERDVAFWQPYLRGFTTPTSLPLDKKSLAEKPADKSIQTTSADTDSPTSRELVQPLEPDTAAALTRLAQSHRVTLNTVFQGAWALLLSRYADAREVLFGITVSGRPPQLAGVESCVGLFINTLPLRITLDPSREVGEWLRYLQSLQRDLLEYPSSSLGDIRGWSDIANNSPLFETILVFENFPLAVDPSQTFAGIRLQCAHIRESTNLPLALVVEPAGEQLSLRWLYLPQRLGQRDILQLQGHFHCLLQALARSLSHSLSPQIQARSEISLSAEPMSQSPLRLGELSMLSPQEYRRVVNQWNQTDADYRRDTCIHTLIEHQVQRSPQRAAVIGDDFKLSYEQLNRAANRIAHTLVDAGLGRGDYVAVCMSRGPEMIPALLGILKSGAAYTAVEPEFPDTRIAQIFNTLKIGCVLTQPQHCARLNNLPLTRQPKLLCPDCNATGPELDSNPTTAVESGDTAYIIFTSGSTGAPKGVMVSHRPVINLIEWVNRRFEVGPADRLLFITSLCFDLSVYDIFGILAAGACVRVAPDAALKDPLRLAQYLYREPITFWDSAPTALQQLQPFFAECEMFPVHADNRPTLRLVFLSGDWIPLKLPEQIHTHFEQAHVIALGGATEATIWSNYFPFASLQPFWNSIPYGRPIQNSRYYILDQRLDPCPAGIPGDLYIGGECLANGYLNAAALTAEKFIPDPFHSIPGARLYNTGDRARFFSDGNIEFLGRRDSQVKLRGFRIELGEVQAALAQHADVRAAVAVVREDRPGQQTLVAYLVAKDERKIDTHAVRQWLQQRLPAPMVPGAWVVMERFPATANGKLDRDALPAPAAAPGEQTPAGAGPAPLSQLEQLLAQIWEQVLGAAPVSKRENFFECGGHSLLATQFIARVRKVLALDIPLTALFEYPSLAQLAEHISHFDRDGDSHWPVVDLDGELPLSFAQERLWFLYLLEPKNPFYNIPITVELSGNLDIQALERSFDHLLRRQQILRTALYVRAGKNYQRVQPFTPVRWQRWSPQQCQPQELQRRLTRHALQPFDLGRPPLLRLALAQLETQRHILQIVTHHIVADGWSMGILLREIATHYNAALSDNPTRDAPLPALTHQYHHFAVWQRQYLSDKRLMRQIKYWQQQLRDLPSLELPTDFPPPETGAFTGETRFFSLGKQRANSLRRLARDNDCTLFMTLLSAFTVVLHYLSRQEDIVLGTDVAARTHADSEALIGFFVNQLVLRCDLRQNPPFERLLKRNRRMTLDAYRHQDLPFEKLVQRLNPARKSGEMPLFQVKFVLQNNPLPDLTLRGLNWKPLPITTATAKYNLLLTFEDSPELPLRIEYCSNRFGPASVERWWRLLQAVIEKIGTQVDITLEALCRHLAERETHSDRQRGQEHRLDSLEQLKNVRRQAFKA